MMELAVAPMPTLWWTANAEDGHAVWDDGIHASVLS